MKTAHLSENILHLSTEAHLTSRVDSTQSLHKAEPQLKWTSNPFNVRLKFSLRGIKYSLTSQIWGNKNDSSFTEVLEEFTLHAHQCEFHVSLCTYCKKE